MHSRRLVAFLVGAWLAASIFMDVAAVQNFRSVDRLLAAPGPLVAQQIQVIGKAETRILLRHQAGETNRFLFEQWELAELFLGVGLVLTLLFASGEPLKFPMLLTLLMLAIVAAGRLYMTPQITAYGRLLDYPNTPGSDVAFFWKLHAAYTSLELVKLGLGFALAAILLINRKDRQKFVRQYASASRSGAPRPVA